MSSDQHSSGFEFSQRPASSQWEQIPAPQLPGGLLWCWVKPPTFPHGIVVTLPPNVDRTQRPVPLRSMLHALQLDASQVVSWMLNGMTFDSQQGRNPLLDQPLPPPLPSGDPGIYIACEQPSQPVPPQGVSNAMSPMIAPPQAPMMASANALNRPMTAAEKEWLEGMDSEWNASLMIESHLSRLRKKIVDTSARLKTLNRDLNTDERTYSSSQDKKDWQDARRWLRDCSMKLARSLKDYDIGFTSNAGQRSVYEDLYDNFIEQGLPFEGMERAYREFQMYHKSLQNLSNSMNGDIQYAQQNGERKAQRILNVIQGKVREGNARKSFLGVISGSQ